MVINAFAKALEVIPRTIADNAGYIIIQFITITNNYMLISWSLNIL